MPTLELTGRLITIGDIAAEDLASFPGVPSAVLELAGERMLLIAGLTREECRALAPAFGERVSVTMQAMATRDRSDD